MKDEDSFMMREKNEKADDMSAWGIGRTSLDLIPERVAGGIAMQISFPGDTAKGKKYGE